MELSPETFKCYVPTTRALDPTGPGALSGVRVAVKDLFSVAGHTSSFGHAQWRATHEPSSEHAAVVARLLSAGGAITGLTKMDQLAYSLIGNVGEGEPPVNPFDPECFCGGSSSGSASAVAGGLADLGVGTDTA
ncbi:MAG: amidase family protein, partial [Gammaproteobacteria bacterium]